MSEVERNSIIAIVLSFLILMIWWKIYSPKVPVKNQKTSSLASSTKKQKREAKIDESKDTEFIELKNEEISCIFGKKSGLLYHLFLQGNTSKVDLIYPDGPKPFLFKLDGKILSNPEIEKRENSIILKFEELTAKFILSQKTLKLLCLNPSKKNLEIIWRGGIGTDKDLLEQQKKRKLVYLHIKKQNRVFKLKEIKEKLWEWLSISNRYFLLAFFPQGKFFVEACLKTPQELINFSSTEETLNLEIFPTIKKYSLLKKMKNGLEKTLAFGLFSPLSIFFLNVLNFFYKFLGNYGWSIVLLTIIIQIFLTPLTRKNIKAAQDMKRIQPYIKKLQEQYKDDPKKLQAELLNVYRVHKVNPLGGCLPMFLQIPIFWSLFTMLQGAVELRGAPFILWIKDLSRPDALFGHFPSFIPFLGGWPVGPLPLLMGALMFLQQRLTITDPQQKAFLIMPVFFTFIFLNFPSGLVLYWLTSNLITFIENLIFLEKK